MLWVEEEEDEETCLQMGFEQKWEMRKNQGHFYNLT